MNKLSIVALVVSLAALAVSVVTYVQADARAEEALRQREKAWVDRLKPHVTRVYQDFAIKDRPDDPQTMDELLVPIFGLAEGLRKEPGQADR